MTDLSYFKPTIQKPFHEVTDFWECIRCGYSGKSELDLLRHKIQCEKEKSEGSL